MFEYKVLMRNNLWKGNLEKELNQLASEGWRVVAISNVKGPLNAVIGNIILERAKDGVSG